MCDLLTERPASTASDNPAAFETINIIDHAWRKQINFTRAAMPHLGERRCFPGIGGILEDPRDSKRAAWVASRVADVWSHGHPMRPLRILEVGPCQMPCRFKPLLPKSVRPLVTVEAADYTNDTTLLRTNCFNGHNTPTVDLVVDAQIMDGVPDQSYDGLIAFHVLEHMADPIGALKAWLRIVRPGGCVLFAVPDICGFGANSDRLRLPPTAAHLVSDHRFAIKHGYKPAALMTRSMRLHGAESAISQGVVVLEMVPKLLSTSHAADGLTAAWAKETAQARRAPCPGMPMTGQPPTSRLWRWLEQVQGSHDIHQNHLHAWSSPAMDEMLEAAEPWLRETSAFRKVENFAAKANPFQMQELHVALERVAV